MKSTPRTLNASVWQWTLISAGLVAWTSPAVGQSSSLFGAPESRAPLTLGSTSFSYQKLPPPRELQLHDLVTVLVNEKSRTYSQGDLQRRRNANLDATLKDWIRLEGLSIKPDVQAEGDPRVQGQLTSQVRAQNLMEARDNLQFTIAATVVDIRPNGNIVLEAHRRIDNNEERWEYFLTGIVRREDILPNNTVLSEDVADLQIQKLESGQVRDGYKRSWMMKLLDRFSPF